MAKTNWRLAMVVVMAMLAGAHAAWAGPLADGQRRIQLSIGPLNVGTHATSARHTAGVIPEAGMLQHFRVEVTDSAGVSVAAGAWTVGIMVSGHAFELSEAMSDFTLPRPLGMRVDATDSLFVVVTVAQARAEGQPVYLRITIEYDAADAGITRLAVVAAAVPAAMAGPTRRTWEWRASADARLLVLAGSALSDAQDLVLEDATTGVVVWRASNRTGQQAFAQRNPYVRLGAALVAGHSYRFTALYASDSGNDAPVVALELPKR